MNHAGRALDAPSCGEPLNLCRFRAKFKRVSFSGASKLSGAAGRNRLLARTKLFLSHWDKVDLMILPNRKKPIHIAKFNTLGLMRSCDTFLCFSLIRNMHEGGATKKRKSAQMRQLLTSTGQ